MKLLFCPFCGSSDIAFVIDETNGREKFKHFVHCRVCCNRTDYYRTPDLAQVKWNQRSGKRKQPRKG